jgi:DnaD/phage-associated family protein
MKQNSALLINEPPIQVIPSLALLLGLNEAIVLQQLHYWLENKKSGRIINGVKWVYNTYEEWRNDNFPFWSERTIQRIFLNLEKIGVIVSTKFDTKNYDQKKYYRIDYDKLALLETTELRDRDGQNVLYDDDKLAPSLNSNTETTPEIISEKTAEINANSVDFSVNLFSIYEHEIGPITQSISESITEAQKTIDDLFPNDKTISTEWIATAIKRSALQNKRSWAYVNGILKKCISQGFMDDGKKPEIKKIRQYAEVA